MSPFPTTVPGDTLLAIPPVNKTAMEGETVTFDCVAKGEGTIVNWFREGVPIPDMQVRVSESVLHNAFSIFLDVLINS